LETPQQTPALRPPTASPTFAPFGLKLFRAIWIASLLSNFGLLIQGVAAAWAMTVLAGRADRVALVQTAMMLPIMLLALQAGALADMFDRRLIGLVATALSMLSAALLTVVAYAGWLSPTSILCLTFVTGLGMALFNPAWQSSIRELVPKEMLPSAIALNSINYNVARSFGPAIGGLIVGALGAVSAFLCNALLCLPLLAVLFTWKRPHVAPRLPPERIDRAMVSGLRFVANAPHIRTVLVRTVLTGLAGGAIPSLMPLVARDLLGGTATIYGLMLGAFGLGAVAGGTQVTWLRRRFGAEKLVAIATASCGVAMLVIAISRSVGLTTGFLAVTGVTWLLMLTCFNVAIQTSSPRWVTGRALAIFQASMAGGVALGSVFWGQLALTNGTAVAMAIAGLLQCVVAGLGRWLPLDETAQKVDEREATAAPDISLQLTARSGPIVIEVDYFIDPADARRFYAAMLKLQRVRQRNGAYGWSLARDLTAMEQWTERFHCPTWHDYLRMRDRVTEADLAAVEDVVRFQVPGVERVFRRSLERPFGSVRWKDETPDPGLTISTEP
jgi:MFS family permease